MEFDDTYASSSVSSSCSSSSSSLNQGLSTACSPATSSLAQGQVLQAPKRRAGRKKFRETRHQVYHGVRERKGGRWVCEVREPRKKGRIWLGTYRTPEMAARAHDVAAIALRGESAHVNFPDSAWALPRASSAAAEDVRRAAAEAARMFRPSSSNYSSSPSPSPQSSSTVPPANARTGGGGSTPPGREEAPVAPVFVDEEALFNMPGLLEDMARGLLVTPPAMQRGFDWDREDDQCLVDLSLWAHQP